MTHLELFAGVGGFSLAAHWAGIKTIAQVERDEFRSSILKKNFPKSEQHGDIKDFDARRFHGKVDVVSCSMPCQPFSKNGKKDGKKSPDYLWPEVRRVLGQVRPGYFLFENVTGVIGTVLDEISDDLESMQYAVESFVLQACAKGAPHERERLFLIAYVADTSEKRRGRLLSRPPRSSNQGCKPTQYYNLAHPYQHIAEFESRTGEPALFGISDGLPPGLDETPVLIERLAAMGEAVVPPFAYDFFNLIKEREWQLQEKILLYL